MRPPALIPDPIDDALRQHFAPAGEISFGCEINDDIIRWWEGRLGTVGLYPRELSERLVVGLPPDRRYRVTKVDPVNEEIRIEVRVYDAEGGQTIFTGRSIEFDAGRIHLNKTTIRDDTQGLRYGRHLLGNAYRLAQDLGLAKLALTALMHGPYVWAKAGFLPKDADWATMITQTKIVQQLYRISDAELSYERKRSIQKFIMNGSQDRLRLLALLDTLVTSSRDTSQQVKLGWYLLVEGEATWKGLLHIGDDVAVDRMRKYLSLGGVLL